LGGEKEQNSRGRDPDSMGGRRTCKERNGFVASTWKRKEGKREPSIAGSRRFLIREGAVPSGVLWPAGDKSKSRTRRVAGGEGGKTYPFKILHSKCGVLNIWRVAASKRRSLLGKGTGELS